MDTHVTSSSSSRDPFDLERLANELAVREQVFGPTDQDLAKDVGIASHDFPLYAPLSHSNPFFSSETFNVEEFLLSRSHTSLPDLRSELRDYLATLKEELVMLINDDYEAFISLSTDLKGEGVRLERMQSPLGDLKAHILESKRELQLIQEAIHTKLRKRSVLRDEKAFLHLLLKISESVSRLESLLVITSPEGATSSPDIQSMSLIKSPDAEGLDGTRGNRAKHLGRVAAEYTQLLYHVNKAQKNHKSAFIEESQWRIDRIKSTLSSDLDHLFASTLHSVTKEGRLNEVDKSKHMADLAECLRTYDVLGLWRDAEDVLRREVIREFVKKTIFPAALSTPRSPLVPHTPFPVRGIVAPAPNTASYPMRTPYTPFTAFASKSNPFESQQHPTAHLLDDTENPLAGLYNTILKFVERDLKRVMELADKVSIVKKSSKANALLQERTDGTKNMTRDGQGYEILANVVWAEVGRAIMDELGSTVFAAGKPDEFRKNHETTQAFLRGLQYLAPSAHSVEAMTAHPVYLAFERRWQLPVYFQLRWQEIVTRLEEALSTSKIEPSSGKENQPFVTSQSVAVWTAITTCWSAEVYIPELSHRLWKLTLQLLSRYRTWLENTLPRLDPPSKFITAEKPTFTPGATPPTITRASTPVPAGEASSAENVAADEATLRQFAVAITDIQAMKSQVLTLWREEISMMLPDMSDVEDPALPEDALEHVLSTITSIVPSLSAHIVAILSKRACEALLPVRSIPSQFRAMSNKRPPTEPSYFVASILRPLKTFFGIGAAEGVGEALTPDYLKPYAEEVFEAVVHRYIYYITAMKKTEESLRRLKKGKKATSGLFGTTSLFGQASSGKEDDNRDEERIRTQMMMDVEAFGKDAELLDVDVRRNSSFISLVEMVQVSLADEN